MKKIRIFFTTTRLIASSLIITVIAVIIVVSTAGHGTANKTVAVADPQLDKDIALAMSGLKAHPKDTKNYIGLANLYLQKARETADSAYYKKVDDLLATATNQDPNNADIFALQASVAAGRHDFKKSLEFAKRASELNPLRPAYFGLVGDAELELGQYEDAIKTFQVMIDKRPDFSSWSRVAYARELYGDISGAKDAMQKAIDAGSSFPENVAWAYNELGKLQMRTSPDDAETSFNRAAVIFKNYAPALEGLGKVAFSRSDAAGAKALFTRAFSILPSAQYAIDLGELAESQGDMSGAKEEYLLAKLAFETTATGGTNTDLEYGVFLADHSSDIALAITKCKAAKLNRPNIHSDDALGWAYFKAGQYPEGQSESHLALRLGENDPLIVFHAGMIAKMNGNKAEARRLLEKALSLNPNFSLAYAAVARTELKTL